ncbi:ARF GTPase-activating protein Git isoform X1 [Phlebotomus argentipes]|uniref:ARF GTPase-activating protein Git isoform X1 n=1 Tax=Phlebotomus argentipes TaxID=94469 RepID=UPI0028931E4F|nr:ARF GTPase-activating protein Git isoform X1 [Phlebotomus argentipes]
MSRIISRTDMEVCGDCGASDPAWASINKGILLCGECCSIHRSLGRHISQVKSLRQGKWSPSVLNLVNSLNSHGANSVWEHLLIDSAAQKHGYKKPSPKDPLHSVKADFIRAKHVQAAFVLRPNFVDGNVKNIESELNKQLHASVRAPNLETSLRLLVQGADPNYFHEEKGSTPLHVAAKFGQLSQVELLIIYGAEIKALDIGGHTAVDLARAEKHTQIVNRLVEAMYEVTDRICNFLCNRKPDHAAGQHIIIPDQTQGEIFEQLKIARGKLFLIPNKMFEELVMDLYDEVDRRENEAIWATSSLNPDSGAVPFLPTNPHLSATRNQGRQKLARFSPTEFAGFLTDVLIDAKRRQNMANLRPLTNAVAGAPPSDRKLTISDANLSDDEPLYDAVASDDDYAALAPMGQQVFGSPMNNSTLTNPEIDVLKKQLTESETTISELKSLVQKLSTENSELKSRCDPWTETDLKMRSDSMSNDGRMEEKTVNELKQNFPKRPVSMFEPRENNNYSRINATGDNNRTATSMYHMTRLNQSDSTIFPTSDEVICRTDAITRRIQDLVGAMQDLTKKNAFVPCAERIHAAVTDLVVIFPTTLDNEAIKTSLSELTGNIEEMQIFCQCLQDSVVTENHEAVDKYLQDVRACAFNLAKATKMLVTEFQLQ